MKYIMCAKTFPAYHPKAGQPTGFRDSILQGRKLHTLRQSAGNRKTGDIVSLREWEGLPYRSKQIEFATCRIQVDPITILTIHDAPLPDRELENLAMCDGFDSVDDFRHWFTQGRDEPIDFDGFCVWFEDVTAPTGRTQ